MDTKGIEMSFKPRKIGCLLFSCTVILSLSNCALFQKRVQIKPIPFNYQAIGKNYFNPKNDKPFPLTIQTGNNLYNSVTADGKYLFYATDKDGNFDIWFRDLESSIVVPVTEHPSQEYRPAISPDGKKLVFVSERYDPDGDLILLKMEPEKWVRASLRGNRFINQRFQVLTNPYWKDPNFQDRVIDTDPAWFPDSKRLVYSTDRFSPRVQNLVLLDIETRETKVLTFQGGASPFVSSDGERIYFLSYRDSEYGEIYCYTMRTEKVQRITYNTTLDFSPSVSRDGKYLYYTSIPKDTNRNGILDERDQSFIVQMDLAKGSTKYLTSGQYSVFDTRYSDFNGGSILFSASLYNAINIYFIPFTGSIPKQDTITEQYNYALSYEGSGFSQYFLALDSVELFFDRDPLYSIYKPRVLTRKIEFAQKNRNPKIRDQYLKELSEDAAKGNPLSKAHFALLQASSTRNPLPEIERILSLAHPEDKEMRASILHLMADTLEKQKKFLQFAQTLERIQLEYPSYHRIREIKSRYGNYEFHSESISFPSYYIESIRQYELRMIDDTPIPNVQKTELQDILQDIHKKISGGRSPDEVLTHIESIQKDPSFPKDLLILKNFMDFLKAEAFSKRKDLKESQNVLNRIIPIPDTLELYPLNQISIFETPEYIKMYRNPALLYSHYLKFQNSKDLGDNSSALRDLQIFMEFYDPILSPELNNKELTYVFQYWENKAVEFERLGNLREAAFHYYFNNLGMALAKSKNLSEEEFYSNYAVYYQRKMIDTIFAHGRSLRAKEEANLLEKVNILGEENLDILGNLSRIFQYIQKLPLLDALKFLGDFRDLRTKDAIHEDALLLSNLYFNYHLERNRPYLNLAVSYGHAYYLINRGVVNEKHLYDRNSMTEAKKLQILENYKKAEYELKWIIYTDPTFADAYQLLGWLYQYIDVMKSKRLAPDEPTEEERYQSAYERYFPEKNFEENVELYTQILEFLGEQYPNKKILSDINLNLGNNYFLLNNFPKAYDSASRVEEYGKFILPRARFDDYRQEAVFRYNFGRAALYRGNTKKAVEQFSIALKLYEENELTSVGIQNNQENLGKDLIELKSKLALLNAMIGLSYMEMGNFENSISYLQQAISHNRVSNSLDSINLWNALAISYQKTGRFLDSENAIRFARESYESNVNSISGFRISIQDFFWNFLLPDNIRIIGEGRFPGDLPLHFKGLLAESISINNHIEKKDYYQALQEIDKRNQFIARRKLRRWVMGNLVYLRTHFLKGQIHYDSGDYYQAYKEFQELSKEFHNLENWEGEKTAHIRRSFSAFALAEEKLGSAPRDGLDSLTKLLDENLDLLYSARKKYIQKCRFSDEEIICDERFQKNFLQYDILAGLNHFYLAESKFLLGDRIPVSYHRMKALLYLENPGTIEPEVHFLNSDPMSRRERIRNLLNLSRMYLRWGDIQRASEIQKKAREIADEFRLAQELFVSDLTALEIELGSDARKILSRLEISHRESESVRMLLPNHIQKEYLEKSKQFYTESGEYWTIPRIMDTHLRNRLSRETIEANLEYSDLELNQKIQSYNRTIRSILTEERILENKSILRENIRQNFITLTKLKTEKNLLEDDILKNYPRYSLFYGKDFNKPLQLDRDSVYIRCYMANGKEIFLVQSGNQKEILRERSSILVSYWQARLKAYKKVLWNPGDCVSYHSEFVRAMPEFRANIVFMDRDVDLSRNREGEDGRGRTILANVETPMQGESHFRLRTVSNQRIGNYLLDTDVLFVPESVQLQRGQIFSVGGAGNLNLREIATNRSEITTIVIEGNSVLLYDLNLLSSLFYHSSIWRDLNIVFTPPLTNEERLSFTRDRLPDTAKITGLLAVRKDPTDYRAKYNELRSLGISQERIRNYEKAYESYFDATAFALNSDKNLYLENSLDLARTKRKIFRNSQPDEFFLPLLEEFRSDTASLNHIYTSFLSDCFSDRQLKNKRDICEKYYKDWIKTNPPQAGEIQLYYSLYKGQTRGLDKKNPDLRVLNDSDHFIKLNGIIDLYVDNFLFDKALQLAQEARILAVTVKEKEMVSHKINEILFHKAFLTGEEDFTYERIDQEITYALGYNREWKRFLERVYSPSFRRLGESDLLFENYRKKMYQCWRNWHYGEEFESFALMPDELYEGGSVLSRLTHLNRTLLFHLIKISSRHQIHSESDRIMNLIIRQELEEGFKIRAYAFMLYYADELIRNGKINSSRQYLIEFEKNFDFNLQFHPLLGSIYSYILFKLSFFTNDIPFRNENYELLNSDDKEVVDLIKKMEKEKISFFESILNQYTKNIKRRNKPFTSYHRARVSDMIQFMKKYSLMINSTEGFIDAVHFEQKINSYTERTLGKKPYFYDLPGFQSVSSELVKRLPPEQEIAILNDFQDTTYLIQIADRTTKGREFFKDSREIKSLIRKYYKNSSASWDDSRTREILDDRYRNFLRLNPARIHYLFLTDYHFKAPILSRRDIQTFHIQNLESLLKNPSLRMASFRWTDSLIEIRKESSFGEPWYRILKSTEALEIRQITSPRGTKVTVNQEEIQVDENGYIVFGGTPVGQISERKSRRSGNWILTSNYLTDSVFLSGDLNSVFYHLDSIQNGIGFVSIIDQSDFHTVDFLKNSLSRKPFPMSGYDRFIESRNTVREKYPFDRFWMGFRLYTTGFLLP